MFNDTRIDIENATENGCPFIFIWGGRGHGKTYPTLKYVIEERKKFVFVKRTKDDVDLLISGTGDADINPFIALNRDMGWNIHPFKFARAFGGFWEAEKNENGDYSPVGEMLGYIIPLSIVSKVKGFNIDADVIIFDEFIPQVGERVLKGTGDAFWNLVETVGRNRELLGKPPLTVVCLANATMLNNPVFASARLITDVEKMLKRGDEVSILRNRGVYLKRLPNTDEFTKAKSETALYKMLKGTRYERSALGNEFSYEDFGLIGYRSMKGFSPVLTISHDGALYGVWMHQGTGEVYFCNSTERHQTVYNVLEEQDRLACKLIFGKYHNRYLKGLLSFETFEIKQVYKEIMK